MLSPAIEGEALQAKGRKHSNPWLPSSFLTPIFRRLHALIIHTSAWRRCYHQSIPGAEAELRKIPWLAQGNPAMFARLEFLRFHLLLFTKPYHVCLGATEGSAGPPTHGVLWGPTLNTTGYWLPVALLSVPNPQPVLRGLFAY